MFLLRYYLGKIPGSLKATTASILCFFLFCFLWLKISFELTSFVLSYIFLFRMQWSQKLYSSFPDKIAVFLKFNFQVEHKRFQEFSYKNSLTTISLTQIHFKNTWYSFAEDVTFSSLVIVRNLCDEVCFCLKTTTSFCSETCEEANVLFLIIWWISYLNTCTL